MDQIAEIKSKVDIVSIINESVKLKKAGRNFQGLCPFHEEKTPSFSVSPEMQIYKCFGCGESGDVITFLEKNEGLEFTEALKILADKAGVKLKRIDTAASKEKDLLKDINEDAVRFYHQILTAHDKGKRALKYLSNRGLKMLTISEFKLGFATEDTSLMSNNLMKQKKYTAKQLEEAGLSYVRYGRAIDRFRGRIIFPINDLQGRTIALAGRILPELSDRGLAKYINSPETKIYHKSRSLFGLDQAKREIKRLDSAILVEGEMDFLSSWQAGVRNVVAIKGTALTEDHITILSRFTKNITLALDSDFAGDKAALRGIAMAQNAQMRIKSLDLGEYKDPDEYSSAEPEKYKKEIENAQDVWEFLIDRLDQRYDLTSANGKAEASGLLIPLLSQIDNEIVREHYLQKLAQKLSVSTNSVYKQSSKFAKKQAQFAKKEIIQEVSKAKSRGQLLEEELLVMVLRFYPFTALREEFKNQLNLRFSKRVVKILEETHTQGEPVNLKKFSDELPNELRGHFSELVIEYTEDPKSPREYINKLFNYLIDVNIKEKGEKIIQEMTLAEKEADEERVSKLQFAFRKLEQTQKSSIIEQGE